MSNLTVPATAMQEALWWVHQRAKNQSVYNLTWRLACSAEPDFDALAVAWQAVVDRHEALRTAVVQRDGAIVLDVEPQAHAEPQRIDVDDPGETPVGTLLQLLAEEVHEQTVALDRPPLARLTLVRVGTECELVLTVHHVVMDGWAIQLLVADLSAAYQAAVDGEKPSFEADAVPFSEYALESVAARDAGTWKPGLEHWRGLLDGAVSTTVAADRHRFAGTGAAGVTLRYAFSQDAADGVAALAKATFGTPFAIVLAALEMVLARGGAGNDVAIGVVVANRMSQREQELVGYLANLCIARARVEPTDTVLDVVSRSRDAIWAMLGHQAVPYPAVFGALTESTQAMLNDYAPLLLNYLGPIGNDLSLGDIGLRLHRTPNRAARSDIAIAFWDAEGGGYLSEIEYNTGRYDRETVLRLLHDLDGVLATGGADPSLRVEELEVRSRAVAGYVDHQPAEETPKPTATAEVQVPVEAGWETVSWVWSEVLGNRPNDPDEDFFAMGGRSLKVLQLAAALEAESGVSLDLIRWLAEPTPRRLADQLAEAGPGGGAKAASTVVTLREGDGPHVHLLHGAGGGPQDYRVLATLLPDGWLVTASQEREPLHSIEEMATRYRADLDAAGLRPDVLAGGSMGCQIAYAMALAYDVPPKLALFDGAPPVGYEPDADFTAQRHDMFVTSLTGSLDREGLATLPRTQGDNPELVVRSLAAYLAAIGEPFPAGSLVERWDTFSRHTDAVMFYLSDVRLRTPTAFVAAGLLDAQVDQWAERLDPAPRRSRLATDHFGMLRPEFAGQLAEAIVSLME
jgi:pimeloyl-ACP methyl ester carboxylesterase